MWVWFLKDYSVVVYIHLRYEDQPFLLKSQNASWIKQSSNFLSSPFFLFPYYATSISLHNLMLQDTFILSSALLLEVLFHYNGLLNKPATISLFSEICTPEGEGLLTSTSLKCLFSRQKQFTCQLKRCYKVIMKNSRGEWV